MSPLGPVPTWATPPAESAAWHLRHAQEHGYALWLTHGPATALRECSGHVSECTENYAVVGGERVPYAAVQELTEL